MSGAFPPPSRPTLSLVDDVPATYAAIVAGRLARPPADPLRLAVSGGTTGLACLQALIAKDLAWERVDLFLVDERCVEAGSPDSNAHSLGEALGAHLSELAGFHRIDCAAGPSAYAEQVRSAGGLDLAQLGMGPDGHTASLFPGSPALEAPSDQLVAANEDPSGANPHPRMTLTYAGIRLADLVVVTVAGAEKREALERLMSGEDLPISRVSARRVVFLVDPPAAGGLPTSELPADLAVEPPA